VLIEELRIAYIVGSSFPTRKAYGITTRETLKVLTDLSITSKIFCNYGDYFDKDFESITGLIENFQNGVLDIFFTKLGKIGNLKFNAICWRIGLFFIIINNFRRVQRFLPNVIWLRDPLIALIYLKKFKNTNIILEVHDQAGKFFHKKLRKYNKRIKFCTINSDNDFFLKKINPLAMSELAPMGIRKELIEDKKNCEEFIDSLKVKKYTNINVGYVGKFSPSGYSKGVEDLINLAHFFQSNKISSNVTLIGAEQQELAQFEKIQAKLKISSKYLKIYEHVSHSQALLMMHNFDVLVLPAYGSKHYIGMPIKLLEYFASGRVVIIADIPLYKKIFNIGFRPFFYIPGDINSLSQTIFIALQSENLKKYLLDGIEFCLPFTWENRTRRILNLNTQ
jgi:glycosyltransferase involved in cell wall biosynthesis